MQLSDFSDRRLVTIIIIRINSNFLGADEDIAIDGLRSSIYIPLWSGCIRADPGVLYWRQDIGVQSR